jgi:hypothetical protein
MWLFEQTGIERHARRSANALRIAMQEARNRKSIKRGDVMFTEPARSYGAMSKNAQVEWGRAISDNLELFFSLDADHPHPTKAVYFVTLADRKCSTTADEQNVDVALFKRRLRRGLKGLSFLGSIEPGYYVNIAAGTGINAKRLVSWHFHGLAWGEDEREIRARFRRLRTRHDWYQPIAPGLHGAYCKRVPRQLIPSARSRTHFADKVRYMLKITDKSYRIYKDEKITSDGEIIPCFRQSKAKLRKGERITLFHLLKRLDLDDLAMAGGEGERILKAAITDVERRRGERGARLTRSNEDRTQGPRAEDHPSFSHSSERP